MKYQAVIITTSGKVELHQIPPSIERTLGMELKITPLNTLTISPIKTSLGIKDVAPIFEWTSRKTDDLKTVIVEDAHKLTLEAQNSLLKILEEPQENTLLILQTNNYEALLETIRSRCILLHWNSPTQQQIEQKGELVTLANEFLNATYLEKIKIVEKILKDYDNKEELGEFLIILIKILVRDHRQAERAESLKILYNGLKANVNTKLIFDSLCLTFAKT